jgi:CRP/FNR family cyclic AMP-dependent transcriptional regulator
MKRDEPAGLSPEVMAEMTKHGVVREFRPRTVILSEGELSNSLYVILEGTAKAYVSDADGREAVLSIMGSGEYFGEVAYDDGPRSASVMTLEACKVLVVPHGGFDELVHGNPDFSLHFIRRLIGRIRALTENVRSLALMDAYGRVARLLLESAEDRDGLKVVPRLTQSDIASRVGCSREMVSRIFKDLVTGGYMTLERDRIVINRKPPARW